GLSTTTNVNQNAADVYPPSLQYNVFNRPQHQANVNATGFFTTGALGHEVKAGFGWRNAPISSTLYWPGSGILAKEAITVRPGLCPTGCAVADIFRPANVGFEYTYYNGVIGDTITTGNLTINAAVRYDYQYGNSTASTIPGNPLFPNLVPGLNYAGGSTEFHWKTFEPRIGANYALGADKRTLLRASYARFADQLGGSVVSWDNPAGGAGIPGSEYVWNDVNHDHTVQPNEIGAFVRDIAGFNHNNPGALSSANMIDRNLDAPLTDEYQVGVEYQILADFATALTGTYRHRTRVLWSPYIGISAPDYAGVFANGLPAHDYLGHQIGVTGPVYGTTPLPDAFTGGSFVTNRPDYSQDYWGAQIQFNKRLTNKWMMHASVAYNDWKQKVSNASTACIDRTNQRLYQDPDPAAAGVGFPGPTVAPSCSSGAAYNQAPGS